MIIFVDVAENYCFNRPTYSVFIHVTAQLPGVNGYIICVTAFASSLLRDAFVSNYIDDVAL